MNTRLLSLFGALLFLFGGASEALAAYGTVHGRILFYQNQGGYCPSSRDCTGANYLQSQFHTNMPVPDVKVYLRDASSNVIGQGVTDRNGYFTISWYSSSSASSLSGNFIWSGEHKDNRFAIRTSEGGQWIFWTYNFTLYSGTSSSSPQELGSYTWGSSSSPNALANVYEGAWRTWYYAFSYSNRMNAYFTGLEVRAFSDQCPTSCAYGSSNRIYLDPNAGYVPQARIMHEMGHIASYKASRDQSYSFGGDYCYPSTGSCGWTFNTAEWSAAAFEEGLATFYGDVALYWSWARQPHTCYASAAACSTGSFNIETSSRSSCVTDEGRWPLSVDRYLWDAYDSNVDYSTETLSRAYYEFFDTVHAFDNGTANRQKDEPFCTTWYGSRYLCDRDGRSAVDFRENWKVWGTNSTDAWSNNCSPAGD